AIRRHSAVRTKRALIGRRPNALRECTGAHARARALSWPDARASIPEPSAMSLPPRSALLTDLYELTMAQAYWLAGRADVQGVFYVSFRRSPFEGGFALACGLDDALARLESFAFTADDLAYLATVPGTAGPPVFRPDFLDYLSRFRIRLDIDAIPEGTPVFPFEPLLRTRGGLLEAQIVETTVLNALNF